MKTRVKILCEDGTEYTTIGQDKSEVYRTFVEEQGKRQACWIGVYETADTVTFEELEIRTGRIIPAYVRDDCHDAYLSSIGIDAHFATTYNRWTRFG